MKRITRLFSAVLCLALVLSLFGVMTVTVSADSNVFYKFESGKNTNKNGIKTLEYNSNGMHIVSDDSNLQVCWGRLKDDQKKFIEAKFNAADSATQANLKTVTDDPTSYKIAIDIDLKKVIGFNATGADFTYYNWDVKRVDPEDPNSEIDPASKKDMGFGVETILILNGKDASGNASSYQTETTVSTVEHPKKTLTMTVPSTIATLDEIVVRFAQGSDLVRGIKSLDVNISNVKIQKSASGGAFGAPGNDCVVDWTKSVWSQLGSSRMAYSGMVNMTASEYSELYPNSAANFSGKGFVGPDCFSHGWEDMGAQGQVKSGALKDYDGIEFYMLSRDTDQWTVAFGVNIKTLLPAKDENGNFIDKNGKKVSSEADAFKIPITFAIPEKDREAAHAGTILKFTYNFNQFICSTTFTDMENYCKAAGLDIDNILPVDSEYDVLIADAGEGLPSAYALAKYKKYITSISVSKGLYAFTGKDVPVEFVISDIYGCKADDFGKLTSDILKPEKYTPPDTDVVDKAAVDAFIKEYKALPKEASAYVGHDDLIARLKALIKLYNAMNLVTKQEVVKQLGYTGKDAMDKWQADWSKMIAIYAQVGNDEDFDPETGDFDLGDDDDFDSPDTGASFPIALAVVAIGAGAALVATKKNRK